MMHKSMAVLRHLSGRHPHGLCSMFVYIQLFCQDRPSKCLITVNINPQTSIGTGAAGDTLAEEAANGIGQCCPGLWFQTLTEGSRGTQKRVDGKDVSPQNQPLSLFRFHSPSSTSQITLGLLILIMEQKQVLLQPLLMINKLLN